MEQDDGGILSLPRAHGWLTDERLDSSTAVAASYRGNRNLSCLLRLHRCGDDRLLRATQDHQERGGKGHQHQKATNIDLHLDSFCL
jgi:hypothetical protein